MAIYMPPKMPPQYSGSQETHMECLGSYLFVFLWFYFKFRGVDRRPRMPEWWRRRESNPRPQVLRYKIYMLSHRF